VSVVSIAPAPAVDAAPVAGPALSLDRLQRHAAATVIRLRSLGQPDDAERILRLTEIGFVPGESVRVVAFGFPGREPIAVRIGRSTFALRAHEAALTEVALA